MTGSPYIEFRNITKTFDGFCALSDVSLSIERGSFVTLLGPSGCGKTTLMRQLAGFSEPDRGEILIDGKQVLGLAPNKRNTPLVFQEYALFPHMTVFENIAYGLKLRRLPLEQRRKEVSRMLQMFNLQGLEKRFPRQLSGGQQQRVAFARALIMGQNILLLDEPLSNLDAKLRVEVRTELRQLQQRLGVTTIYVTHDQDEALSMSDVIAVMRNGKIEQVGTPWQIYYKPATRFVADFVGVVNFLQATVEDVYDGGAVVRCCGRTIRVNGDSAFSPGQAVTLAVRPECLAFADGASSAQTAMSGDIVSASFLGRITRYLVRVAGQMLVVDGADSGSPVTRSGQVSLTLDAGRVHVLAGEGDHA